MTIRMYTKDNCTWCVKAKRLLMDLGLNFDELKLDRDFTKDDLRAMVGPNVPLTVPQVYINDKRVGGYEDLAEYLEDHGMMGLQS